MTDPVLAAVDSRWTTFPAVRRDVHAAETRAGAKVSQDTEIRRRLAGLVRAGRLEVLGVADRQMWRVKP